MKYMKYKNSLKYKKNLKYKKRSIKKGGAEPIVEDPKKVVEPVVEPESDPKIDQNKELKEKYKSIAMEELKDAASPENIQLIQQTSKVGEVLIDAASKPVEKLVDKSIDIAGQASQKLMEQGSQAILNLVGVIPVVVEAVEAVRVGLKV